MWFGLNQLSHAPNAAKPASTAMTALRSLPFMFPEMGTLRPPGNRTCAPAATLRVTNACLICPPGGGAMARKTVLVVEDDPPLRREILELLAGMGLAGVEAADGA